MFPVNSDHHFINLGHCRRPSRRRWAASEPCRQRSARRRADSCAMSSSPQPPPARRRPDLPCALVGETATSHLHGQRFVPRRACRACELPQLLGAATDHHEVTPVPHTPRHPPQQLDVTVGQCGRNGRNGRNGKLDVTVGQCGATPRLRLTAAAACAWVRAAQSNHC
jgi:hypothetical protein